MSLENLLKIGLLEKREFEAGEIERLLGAAERSVADARVALISTETRFDAAYRAIMQVGLAALAAQGFRPDMRRPGHHMTTIQSLALTLEIDSRRIVVLDTLRRKRNLVDYTGEDIDEESVMACVEEAEDLLGLARLANL